MNIILIALTVYCAYLMWAIIDYFVKFKERGKDKFFFFCSFIAPLVILIVVVDAFITNSIFIEYSNRLVALLSADKVSIVVWYWLGLDCLTIYIPLMLYPIGKTILNKYKE